MIYTVGIKSKKFSSATIEDCLEYFKDHESIQYDGETTGLDPHTDSLKCFQIGDAFNQYVIAPEYLQDFKDLIETKELVGQNLKFDLKWLYKHNIWPSKVWDTYLAEGVLFCGYKLHKKNLAAIAKRTIQVDIDKSVQESIWRKLTLNDQEIEYSANDVKYLDLIRNEQTKELRQKGLEKVLEIENQFVLCLAYIEYCGFKLDREKWSKKAESDRIAYEKSLQTLNQYVIKNNHREYFTKQLDLFSSDIKIDINWSSPKQVIPLFKKLGINTSIVEGGVLKDSIESTHLIHQKDKFDILPLYLEYKEKEKVVSTYGYGFLEHINKTTGRIHTNFTQIMNTGRISSGGRDNGPNLQNLPHDPVTRACFVAEEGNSFVIADYQSQENIVLVNQCLDPTLLEFYDSGNEDMHSFVAKQVFPELAEISFKDIKEFHSDKRNIAKTAGFALLYGATGSTIAENAGIPLEDGNRFYDNYFKVFPGLRGHFEKSKKDGIDKGYILVNEIYGRKSFIYNYEEFLELKKELTTSFWDTYKALKQRANSGDITPRYLEMKEKVSKYFKIRGDIERKACNYKIQGTAGDITKIACIKMFNYIKDNNLLDIIKMVNVVHDEIVLECPLSIIPESSYALKDAMESAGRIFCQRVPLKAVTESSLFWKK